MVVGGDLDTAAPAVGSEEKHAVGIWYFRPVNVDGVIVKTFVQGTCVTDPGAVLTFRKRAAVSETHSDALGLGCNDAEFDSAFRIDLGILLVRLIGRRRLEILYRRRSLRRGGRSQQPTTRKEEAPVDRSGIWTSSPVRPREPAVRPREPLRRPGSPHGWS